MEQVKIICPSSKLPAIHTDIDSMIICVDEKELEAYKEQNEREIITHPGLNNLSKIRQFIYEKFGDVFMVDDDIFYCPSPKIDRIDEIFKKEEDLCCFSLRLGLNTTVQDPHNRASLAELPAIRLDEDVFLWDHTTVGLNFGYPLSLDCHIFRTDFIFDLIKQIEFSSPNFLEGNLQKFSKECPPVCAAANSSSVFGAPINRVQNDFTNRAGLEFGMDPKALNKEFLKGKTLCPVIDKIVGAHQEVELKWES